MPDPAAAPIGADARPRLAPGIRLRFDEVRNGWMLLGPERVIETEGPVGEILRRCDGNRTLGEIVDELAAIYAAERSEIASDVDDLLRELIARRLVTT